MKIHFLILFTIILAKSFILGWYINQEYIGLGPDEAQYWTWSEALDWGYYSKPAGIAFQIKFGTLLFGSTELGVRLGSLLLGSLMPFSIWYLCVLAGLEINIAFWSALAMALTPLGIASSFFAITDIGMIFFWILASLPIAKAMRDRISPNYLHIGLLIAAGAFFKWPIYLFWLVVVLGMFIFPYLRNKTIFIGLLISLLGLLPSLIWNVQHDWVTFKHVEATLAGQHVHEGGATLLFKGNALEFLAAQAALLSPILFVLMVISWFIVLPKLKDESVPALIRWGALSSFVMIFGYTLMAFFQKMQGNWADFAYPLAIPAIVWTNLRWTKIGVAFSTACMVILLAIPLPIHPFKHNMGWKKIAASLNNFDLSNSFLFGETYQMASILSFYGPEQKRAYFFNLEGARKNQFDLWPGMAEEQVGHTGYFVQVEYGQKNDLSKHQKLLNYFDEVSDLGSFTLDPDLKKSIHVWRCKNYNGAKPLLSQFY